MENTVYATYICTLCAAHGSRVSSGGGVTSSCPVKVVGEASVALQERTHVVLEVARKDWKGYEGHM